MSDEISHSSYPAIAYFLKRRYLDRINLIAVFSTVLIIRKAKNTTVKKAIVIAIKSGKPNRNNLFAIMPPIT
jgi:hypothetical protein